MSDVDEIKQRIDIVDLISQHVALKRAGRGYTALCPFHSERTPSFHVDPQRQTWHCFGACGTGGDIFSFIMKKEGCEFREAMNVLAERAGIALHQRRDVQEDARRARLYDVNEAAAAFFAATVLTEEGAHAAGAAKAREYIRERRLADASVERFQLGYAPNSWDALLHHLETRGFTPQDAVAAGIAIEGDRGPYDRFRHRLMFPIRDDRGRVAGFGGRLLPGDALGAGDGNQPKYVNTSQSPIFDKGAILYALDLAKDPIRSEGRAVIVEGYMDVIAAHEHGFTNVIASMGTALTERQVALLKRHTKNLVLALDADAAGSDATLRGVQVVADAVDHETIPVADWRGVIKHQETLAADIRVLTMPEGRDPDDVIRTDAELWPRLVNEAKPVLDYLFDAVTARHDLSQPRERSAVSSELLPMIAAVSDKVVQSHYMQQLARIAQTDEATLRQEMRAPVRKQNVSHEAKENVPAGAAARASGARDKKEEFCLALLFRYPELLAEGMTIDAHLFGYSENRALFETWVGWTEGGEPAPHTAFEDLLTADLRPQYERILNTSLPSYDDDALVKALRSTVWGMEQQRLKIAERATRAVVFEMTQQGSEHVLTKQRESWEHGDAPEVQADDEADPVAVFVENVELQQQVHQRLLEQRRRPGRAAGEVVNDG
jgi:DNA primase